MSCTSRDIRYRDEDAEHEEGAEERDEDVVDSAHQVRARRGLRLQGCEPPFQPPFIPFKPPFTPIKPPFIPVKPPLIPPFKPLYITIKPAFLSFKPPFIPFSFHMRM